MPLTAAVVTAWLDVTEGVNARIQGQEWLDFDRRCRACLGGLCVGPEWQEMFRWHGMFVHSLARGTNRRGALDLKFCDKCISLQWQLCLCQNGHTKKIFTFLGPIYTWRRICRRSLDEVATNSRRSLSEVFLAKKLLRDFVDEEFLI